jgi:hypothetical protein
LGYDTESSPGSGRDALRRPPRIQKLATLPLVSMQARTRREIGSLLKRRNARLGDTRRFPNFGDGHIPLHIQV